MLKPIPFRCHALHSETGSSGNAYPRWGDLGTDNRGSYLFDLALEVLASDQVGDVVVIGLLLALGHALVALGQFAERG